MGVSGEPFEELLSAKWVDDEEAACGGVAEFHMVVFDALVKFLECVDESVRCADEASSCRVCEEFSASRDGEL